MASKTKDRVIFHSKEDLSAYYYLKKAEKLLSNLDSSGITEINDLLELHHVKLYFDNGLTLPAWDKKIKSDFISVVNEAMVRVKDFFLSLADNTIVSLAGKLEFSYRKSFWSLFNYYQVFKKINGSTMIAVLEANPQQLGHILAHFKTVTHFDQELRSFLLTCPKAAELLLSEFEKEGSRDTDYIFPKSLTLTDKEEIIKNYLDHKDANLNYVRLIEHSKNSGNLKLSSKTRLKAKKKSEELNNQLFQEGGQEGIGVRVILDKDQSEPVKFTQAGNDFELSYSEIFLDQQQDDVSLFMLFKSLFEFTDHNGLITLVSKTSELDILEILLMKSRNEYLAGFGFDHKNKTALLQILLFEQYLLNKGRSIEDLVQSFIASGLNKDLRLVNMQFHFPAGSSTFLEKIRVLAPELEFLLKQCQAFLTEGEIDFELIQVDSTLLKLSDIKSPSGKKYAYAKSDVTEKLKHQFFSGQSHLFYIEPFNDKYSSFYDLLQSEDVKLEDFHNYQQGPVKNLVDDGYLFIDNNDYIKIKDDILIHMIGELFRNEVISYWHYPVQVRDVLNEMEKNGFISFDNSFFSRQEINYFNYYLNMKSYTNGLNIRNKYLHGANSGSEKEHRYEYYILLKLIILVLLKIVDDVVIRYQVKQEMK